MIDNYRKLSHRVNYNSKTDLGIALDLDETLIKCENYDVNMGENIELELMVLNRIFPIKLVDCIGPKGRGEIEYYKIIKRYGLDAFLEECNRTFRVVIVWSAGKERYVESIVDKLFTHENHPYMVYHFKQCDMSQGYVVKDLKEMYRNNPELSSIVPINKMFIVDDNDYTFERNKTNGVLIKKFRPLENINNIFNNDGELRRVFNQILNFRI